MSRNTCEQASQPEDVQMQRTHHLKPSSQSLQRSKRGGLCMRPATPLPGRMIAPPAGGLFTQADAQREIKQEARKGIAKKDRSHNLACGAAPTAAHSPTHSSTPMQPLGCKNTACPRQTVCLLCACTIPTIKPNNKPVPAQDLCWPHMQKLAGLPEQPEGERCCGLVWLHHIAVGNAGEVCDCDVTIVALQCRHTANKTVGNVL